MNIDSLFPELNEKQKQAVILENQNILAISGPGTGKTKTISARAALLISSGIPAERIQILTFTNRAAKELKKRLETLLGDASKNLRASTFHSFCYGQILQAQTVFGVKNISFIEQDDQLQIFKLLRGKTSATVLPLADKLLNLYTYTRNTLLPLDETLQLKMPEYYHQKDAIALVIRGYEEKKRKQNYIDYDDMIAIVAKQTSTIPEVCTHIANQFDHILVDEMQDTNPLQWQLLAPLLGRVKLFCVGDDAQSIYGFRHAVPNRGA
jgi:DNA helicase-2/ATP-dependent DNA helicase PcrA